MRDQPDFSKIDGYTVRRPYGTNPETAAVPPATAAARSGSHPPFTRTRRTQGDDHYITELDKLRREYGLSRNARIGDLVNAPVMRISRFDGIILGLICFGVCFCMGVVILTGKLF